MKRFYLFVHDTKCTPATTFYRVAIGQSARDQQIKLKLEAVSSSCSDFYFIPYTDKARTFLERVAQSFDLSVFKLNVQTITTREAFNLVPTRHVLNLSRYMLNL